MDMSRLMAFYKCSSSYYYYYSLSVLSDRLTKQFTTLFNEVIIRHYVPLTTRTTVVFIPIHVYIFREHISASHI